MHTTRVVRNYAWKRFWHQVHDNGWGYAWPKVRAQIRGPIGRQVDEQVWNQVWSQAYRQINEGTKNENE